MNGMTPHLARLLVEERLDEAAKLRQRRAAGSRRATATTGTPRVPRQRRAGALMNRLFGGYGVHVPTR